MNIQQEIQAGFNAQKLQVVSAKSTAGVLRDRKKVVDKKSGR